MKTRISLKESALLCAFLLASCSAENEVLDIASDGNTTVADESLVAVEVGDNEYLITGNSEVEGSESRTIVDKYFIDYYDPDSIYVHSTNPDSNAVVTLILDESRNFAYRLRINDDGSYEMSGNTSVAVGEDPTNYAKYAAGDSIYFSSWKENEWTNDISGTIQIAATKYLSYMNWQDREGMGNWNEMYRSNENYSVKDMYTTDLREYILERVVSA